MGLAEYSDEERIELSKYLFTWDELKQLKVTFSTDPLVFDEDFCHLRNH